MYVIQHKPGYNILHELDKKALGYAKKAYPDHRFTVISGLAAHHWVRDGGHHSTPLYIDNGRIRYARDAR
jgi:hypothetical protein